jgi:thiamine pyrophosphate-dependent acetolactate synthase large subunit-like protein
MSMADGYARVTGRPQCVIVHVDVGTQAVAHAMHNASVGRAPVLVFAGLSPFTLDGEMRGSRTEFIHWLQDVPDQRAIVAQYCRYAAEVKTGANMRQMVGRALQMATSDPQGPVYLCAAREVMEAEIADRTEPYVPEHWAPVQLGGLPSGAPDRIAEALAAAERPLLITGYSGRDHAVPGALAALADALPSLRVLEATTSDVCFPGDHPAWLGTSGGRHPSIETADAILILHCDVPWIPTQCRPSPAARIFHVDVDPLKQQMPLFYLPAEARYRADALAAIQQITDSFRSGAGAAVLDKAGADRLASAAETRRRDFDHLVSQTAAAAEQPLADGRFGTGHLSRVLRAVCPDDTVWAVEAVTNTRFVHANIRPTHPGSYINSGAGGLGWSGGATLGIKMALDDAAAKHDSGAKGSFVCQVVGDGTYMFSVPGSVYWIARRYEIPVLTVVLNNKGLLESGFLGMADIVLTVAPGWNAPRESLLLVHPEGEGSKVSNKDINISFDPTPDYAGIAAAAGSGEIHALQVRHASELRSVLEDAVAKVLAGKTTVVDCAVVPGC